MVERSLSMREVRGSIPRTSITFKILRTITFAFYSNTSKYGWIHGVLLPKIVQIVA